MLNVRRFMLLALPASLLGAPVVRGDEDTSSSAPGITREDQREERFYNFDQGRQSGGGFTDPSDLIRKLQKARSLQYATDPEETMDAALEDFLWPDESPPEEEQTTDPVDSVANHGNGAIRIPDDLFTQVTPDTTEGEPETSEEEGEEDEEEDKEADNRPPSAVTP